MAAKIGLPGKLTLEMLECLPDSPSRTIAQALHREHPEVFPTVEKARDCVRYYRGNHGSKNRSNATERKYLRPSMPAGWKLAIPEPDAETWEPFILDNCSRVLSLSDIHVPYHDANALRLAIETGKRNKVDCVILNGDTIDFHSISRWEHDPRKRDAVSEIKDVVQLMLYLGQEFPEARLIYKEGNHDERWSKYIWQAAPILWQLEFVWLENVLGNVMRATTENDSASLADYGWEYVKDQRVIMAGKLPILHGHELPKGLASPVNPARGAYMRTAHTLLIGHGHRSSHHVEPDMFGREVACWSQGCLCGMNPQYARINKWNQGFAYVEISDGGEFELTNYRIADGKARAS